MLFSNCSAVTVRSRVHALYFLPFSPRPLHSECTQTPIVEKKPLTGTQGYPTHSCVGCHRCVPLEPAHVAICLVSATLYQQTRTSQATSIAAKNYTIHQPSHSAGAPRSCPKLDTTPSKSANDQESTRHGCIVLFCFSVYCH